MESAVERKTSRDRRTTGGPDARGNNCSFHGACNLAKGRITSSAWATRDTCVATFSAVQRSNLGRARAILLQSNSRSELRMRECRTTKTNKRTIR